MLVNPTSQNSKRRRPGKILVTLAILLVVLLGMVGLVIDSGFLLANYRNAQNVADAAAMAAAMELFRGETPANAKIVAEKFVKEHNALANATVTVNIPPVSGPHAGSPKYAEVYVTKPLTTYIVQILGIDKNQEVLARAVAGYEAIAGGEGAIVLDPLARPGLAITGGATLKVDGTVIVNSKAGGVDQYGLNVDWGLQKYALTTSNNSKILARGILVKGGVDVPANYQSYDAGGPSPLYCRYSICPDPLRLLPIPTDKNGVDTTLRGAVSYGSGSVVTLQPGIYEDILINGDAKVTFAPGIYVFNPTKPNQGLRANGQPTIVGEGVMFYMTGSNYVNANGYGYYDIQDDALNNQLDRMLPPTFGPEAMPPAPDSGSVEFATMDFNVTGGKVRFTGLVDPNNGPFNNVMFFQRRRNTNAARIQGVAGSDVYLGGAIYAKWANFALAGGSRYDNQFVVGSMSIAGQAEVILLSGGRDFGLSNQVFLVE